MDDLERFFALERRLLARLSTRTIPFAGGEAFLDEGFPDRYVSNFLRVDGSGRGISPRTVLQEADRILGGSGFEYRSVVVTDEREGERLAPAFAGDGYTAERELVMVHVRPPDRVPDLSVEELPFAEILPLLLEVYSREPYVTSELQARTFAEQHGKFERVIGARFFAVRLAGELAGNCELYVDGRDAQVEFVDTLEEHRGRGVARAVVLRAIDEAREAGAERVFIVADHDDWPKELYARLGFDPIGRSWWFLRSPSTAGRAR